MLGQMNLLRELVVELARAKDFASALDIVLHKICTATGWAYGDVWAPALNGHHLVCLRAWHTPSAELEKFKQRSMRFTFAPGAGFPGRIWSSGKPAWILDVTQDANFPRAPIARECGLKAGMGVPILNNDEVVAVMSFFILERREKDEQMIGLIATIAAELGNIFKYKQMEKRLLQLSGAVEQSIGSVMITDINGAIEYINPTFSQITGYTPDEVIGKNPSLLKSGATSLATYKNLWETITTGNSWRGVFCNKKKDGDLYWEQANISPIKDLDGNITHFLGYKEDVTVRRRNEQRIGTEHAITTILAAANSLAEVSPEILKAICGCIGWDYGEIWQVDRDAQLLRNIEIWHIPAINPAKFIELTKQLVFRRGDGIPGRVWKEGKPVWVADVTRDTNFIRKFIASVEGLRGAIGFPVISNGECVGIMVFFNREMQPPDNELLTMLEAIGRQIGQFIMRKRAEAQLHKLSQAAEQSPSTIILTDTNGYIRYANLRFTQLTGYMLDEVIGKTPSFLDSGITPQEVYKRLWGTITSGEERTGEVISKKKSGEFYHERIRISSIKDEKGAITNFLITGEDITLLKEAEEEQKQLRSQLYHTQKLESIGQLAGGIAHDFNNIIMAIMGYANFLKLELGEDNPLSQYPVKLLAVAERAEKLTSGLLAFSRKQVFNLQTVSTNHIITSALSFLGMLIKSDIELKISLSENDCFIVADKNQIEQVLINLATNARDAMPKGGSLTIKTEGVELDNTFVDTYHYGKPGKYALISVTDTGMGMDAKTIKKIFEPFFTTKDVGKGTGLGLAIVYGIVKQHNGFINVYSEPGKGTIFKIYLPLSKIVPLSATDSSPYRTVDLPKHEIPKGGKEEILVADDSEEVRDILKRSLERNGYRAIVAVDGDDAIQKFTENMDAIRLLLFDVVMPKINGVDAYLEIKKMRPDIKAIFISGFNNNVVHENIRQNKDVCFITKPILPTNLLEKVEKALHVYV